jgi:Domain of unknown function (DUF4291)
MKLITEPYHEQSRRWPKEGHHILAQFDQDSVVVYQAYRGAIGHFAAEHQFFGGEFKLDRMSWIKPNFLWMMYRSGWGTKDGQEVILAVRIKRKGFEQILADAVHSNFARDLYSSKEAWQKAVSASSVRLQWDPDHNPSGNKEARRAIQLGLRGSTIARYSREWIVSITDISGFVAEQRANTRSPYKGLMTPREEVYPVPDASVRASVGLDNWSE